MGKTTKDIKRYLMKSDSENYKHFEELHPPSKRFKAGYRRSHKAKAKMAVKNGLYDVIPEFKKCHRYQWRLDW